MSSSILETPFHQCIRSDINTESTQAAKFNAPEDIRLTKNFQCSGPNDRTLIVAPE
jgi:hypothetical protein